MKDSDKFILGTLVVGYALGSFSFELKADDLKVFISSFATGDEGAVHAFRLDVQAAALRPMGRFTDVENPFFLAISPDRRFLYSIHAPGQFGGEANEQVAAYRIEDKTGELTLLNRQSTLGTASCFLDIDATGRTLVVANYTTGNVASLPILEDGSLGEAASMIQHAGSSIDPARQTGPHAHCLVVSPDNRFAYAADLGLDQVRAYRLDVDAATLSPNRQPFVRTLPGAGPRHLTFHPGRMHLYVINELANSITLFDYEQDSGILIEQQTISTLPGEFEGKSHCADLKIPPCGKFLYGTNRGHDSIAAYRIGDDGSLSLLGIVPSLGRGPQNLAITLGGELLLCANMPGDNVSIFRIDAQSGELESTGPPISLPRPSCIMIR